LSSRERDAKVPADAYANGKGPRCPPLADSAGNKTGTYTVPEAGKRLKIGRNQAYAAAKRGEIPTIKIGRSLRVPKPAFDRLLEG
jgi:excisionase family DNA binding protein